MFTNICVRLRHPASVQRFNRFLLAACFFGLLLSSPANAIDPKCTSLEHCLEMLQTYDLRDPYHPGMNFMVDRIAVQILPYGPEAVTALVDLLKTRNDQVFDRVAYALFKFQEIDPVHTDALIAAAKRRTSWLPMVIMRTGQDRGTDFLVDALSRHPERWSEGLIIQALASYPHRTAVPLLLRLSCHRRCNEDDVLNTIATFREMPFYPDDIAPVLRELLVDEKQYAGVRRAAFQITGMLGKTAEPLLEDLIEIYHAKGDYWQEAVHALSDLGHPAAALGLMDILDLQTYKRPEALIKSIGALGANGYEAGPRLLEHFKRPLNWDEHWAIAKALGEIGYEPATPALSYRLTSADWALTYHAMASLASLGSGMHVIEKQAYLKDHWSETVRNAYARMSLSILSPEAAKEELPEVQLTLKLEVREDDLGRCSRGHIETSGGAITIRPDFELEGVSKRERKSGPLPKDVPDLKELGRISAARRVPNGWIIGIDNGEWGGGLYFVDARNRSFEILDENVFDITEQSGNLLVITGLGHLALTDGEVWEIRQLDGGQYSVGQTLRLPSNPTQTTASEDGTFVVVTHDGAVGLKDGAPFRVDCLE